MGELEAKVAEANRVVKESKNESVYLNEAVLQHYMNGIQYALAHLEADARPSAEVGKERSKNGCEETYLHSICSSCLCVVIGNVGWI